MTNGSMTKAELVEEVSRVSDLTKKHSEVIVDTVFRSIIEALHRGEKHSRHAHVNSIDSTSADDVRAVVALERLTNEIEVVRVL